MDHFGAIVAGAAGGDGDGTDQAREADGTEINGVQILVSSKLPVEEGVVSSQSLAIELLQPYMVWGQATRVP